MDIVQHIEIFVLLILKPFQLPKMIPVVFSRKFTGKQNWYFTCVRNKDLILTAFNGVVFKILPLAALQWKKDWLYCLNWTVEEVEQGPQLLFCFHGSLCSNILLLSQEFLLLLPWLGGLSLLPAAILDQQHDNHWYHVT